MILKPRNLKQMAGALRRLVPDQRKVIVLVGRHPNEGTDIIAKRHHGDWEKHGAVVVQFPRHWTPHGFWHSAMRRKLSLAEVKRRYDKIPQRHLIATLEEEFKVPFVNFHGTPLFDPSVHGCKQPFVEFQASSAMNLKPHTLIAEGGSLIHPNEVLVEFYFKGKKKRAYVKALKYADRLSLEEPESDELPPDYEASYLLHKWIDRKALELFSRKHAPKFEKVIAHLANTGLKRSKSS